MTAKASLDAIKHLARGHAEEQILTDLALGQETRFASPTSIRSSFLRSLFTNPDTSQLITLSGLRLDNLRLDSHLDLRGVRGGGIVRLRRVSTEFDMRLDHSDFQTIVFEACRARVLNLSSSSISGSLFVRGWEDRDSSFLKIECPGAQIERHLELSDVSVGPTEDRDFDADTSRRRVGDKSDLDRFVAAPPTVELDQSTIGGSLFIIDSLIRGGLQAPDVSIGRNINIIGADIDARPKAPAVDLIRSRVEGAVFIHDPMFAFDAADHTNGRTSTRLGGQLDLGGSRIGGWIRLQGLEVEAHSDPSAPAGISIQGATVGGGIDTFRTAVAGSVDISGSSIGSDVNCDYLDISAVTGFTRDGTKTRVSADPDAERRTGDDIERRDLGHDGVFNAARARIAGVLRWDPTLVGNEDRIVDLTDSRLGALSYAYPSSWPSTIRLTNVGFDRIHADHVRFRRPSLAGWATSRLAWDQDARPDLPVLGGLHDFVYAGNESHLSMIEKHADAVGHDRALYEGVAAALAGQGRTSDARTVLVAGHNAGNRANGWSRVVLGLPYRVFAGNGYHPGRSLLWAAAVVVLGTLIFSNAFENGDLEPTDTAAVVQPFNAFVFSADTLLPIVDLHQADNFEATGEGWSLTRIYIWFQIVIGWVIASTLGATAANFVRRVRST
ncbi:MAG: hypothetical protein AAF467_01420 [Actinomycetota bacterium]